MAGPVVATGSTKFKRRQKVVLELDLFEPTKSSFPILDVETELQKRGIKTRQGSDDDADHGEYTSEEHRRLKEIAQKMEAKYGKTKMKKDKKLRFGRVEDQIDMGMGYDKEDPFIDDTEAYDELIPSTMDTKHGGFYVNRGILEFVEISESDEEADLGDDTSEGEEEEVEVQEVEDSESEDEIGVEKKRTRIVEDDDSDMEVDDVVEVDRQKQPKVLEKPNFTAVKPVTVNGVVNGPTASPPKEKIKEPKEKPVVEKPKSALPKQSSKKDEKKPEKHKAPQGQGSSRPAGPSQKKPKTVREIIQEKEVKTKSLKKEQFDQTGTKKTVSGHKEKARLNGSGHRAESIPNVVRDNATAQRSPVMDKAIADAKSVDFAELDAYLHNDPDSSYEDLPLASLTERLADGSVPLKKHILTPDRPNQKPSQMPVVHGDDSPIIVSNTNRLLHDKKREKSIVAPKTEQSAPLPKFGSGSATPNPEATAHPAVAPQANHRDTMRGQPPTMKSKQKLKVPAPAAVSTLSTAAAGQGTFVPKPQKSHHAQGPAPKPDIADQPDIKALADQLLKLKKAQPDKTMFFKCVPESTDLLFRLSVCMDSLNVDQKNKNRYWTWFAEQLGTTPKTIKKHLEKLTGAKQQSEKNAPHAQINGDTAAAPEQEPKEEGPKKLSLTMMVSNQFGRDMTRFPEVFKVAWSDADRSITSAVNESRNMIMNPDMPPVFMWTDDILNKLEQVVGAALTIFEGVSSIDDLGPLVDQIVKLFPSFARVTRVMVSEALKTKRLPPIRPPEPNMLDPPDRRHDRNSPRPDERKQHRLHPYNPPGGQHRHRVRDGSPNPRRGSSPYNRPLPSVATLSASADRLTSPPALPRPQTPAHPGKMNITDYISPERPRGSVALNNYQLLKPCDDPLDPGLPRVPLLNVDGQPPPEPRIEVLDDAIPTSQPVPYFVGYSGNMGTPTSTSATFNLPQAGLPQGGYQALPNRDRQKPPKKTIPSLFTNMTDQLSSAEMNVIDIQTPSMSSWQTIAPSNNSSQPPVIEQMSTPVSVMISQHLAGMAPVSGLQANLQPMYYTTSAGINSLAGSDPRRAPNPQPAPAVDPFELLARAQQAVPPPADAIFQQIFPPDLAGFAQIRNRPRTPNPQSGPGHVFSGTWAQPR